MWQSTAFVEDQRERWSTACGEIATSVSLGTVLSGLQKNPDVILFKIARCLAVLDRV